MRYGCIDVQQARGVVRWVETSISSKNPTSTAIKKRRNQFKPLSFSSVLPRSGWNPAGSKGPESLRQTGQRMPLPSDARRTDQSEILKCATIWDYMILRCSFLIQIETIARLRIVLLSALKIHELPALSIPFNSKGRNSRRRGASTRPQNPDKGAQWRSESTQGIEKGTLLVGSFKTPSFGGRIVDGKLWHMSWETKQQSLIAWHGGNSEIRGHKYAEVL